jgi:SAM-dependent methyltransferase
MHLELLKILRCPRSGEDLELVDPTHEDGRIRTGMLVARSSGHRYPIREFIPRFAPESNYTDNFGMQWNEFRQTQLDSYSGHSISGDRFWKATGWRSQELEGQWVLDAGCGAGRFAEVAVKAGAKLIALDYSSAVDACYANLRHHPNLHVVQGDIYALPFLKGFFPYVYSLGVLQHTPDVARAFAALPPMLIPGGRLCTDFYWKRMRTMLHMKYLLRPFTKRMSQQKLFRGLQRVVPRLLPLSQTLGRVPAFGVALKRLVPIADCSTYPLNARQLEEWVLLDTFDMLAPEYDNPQTAKTIRRWCSASGLVDIEVFHEGHLVGRGRKETRATQQAK